MAQALEPSGVWVRRVERERRARLQAEAVAEAATRDLYEKVGELERTRADLENFLWVASHDLLEPVRALLLLTDPGSEDFDRDPRAGVARARRAAYHLREIILDLRRYARVGTDRVAREPIDLEAELHQLAAARDLEPGSEIEILSIPPVVGDPGQIRQLFAELLDNAIRFRKPASRPRIQVDAKLSPPDRVELHVTDRGIGFHPRHAQRILMPFKRLHRRDAYPGTGIGLAIGHRIVRNHGGELVANARPEEGATFIVTLPAACPSGRAPQRSS